MTTPTDLAIADLGYHEQPPGSNRTKYGDRFWPGLPSPWCAEMLSCNTKDAGGTGPYSASVGFWRNQARAAGLIVDRAGALAALAQGLNVAVGWEWGKDQWPDHIGWLLGDQAGHDHTIEGNSPQPNGLGDQVGYHVRPLDQVAFYAVVHPASPEVNPTIPAGPAPAPAPVHPAGPILPPWMVLTMTPRGRPGFTNHGDRVAVLQAFFTHLGGPWDPHGVDGVIGPRTNDIIGRFQASKGLRVDREVGQATWHAAFGA